MAKCTIEPKLDFDKFKEACERFKKICEREMGEAFPNIDTEYPVVLKNTRDCETCVHARPFGGENDNRCSVWECDYINRDKAIEAYADGYNDAFERFCECLKERPLTKAIRKMRVWVDAVNNVIMRKEGE